MGESLVWAEGAEHRRLRAAFSPCFSCVYYPFSSVFRGCTGLTSGVCFPFRLQKVREMEPIVLKAANMVGLPVFPESIVTQNLI